MTSIYGISIFSIINSTEIKLNSVSVNNMPLKFLYAPSFTNPGSCTFDSIIDDNIDGCLGFEISSDISPINFDNLTFTNFSSTSLNSIASVFYFPSANFINSVFSNCSFTNLSSYGSVIKFSNPDLTSTISLSNNTFTNCTLIDDSSVVSFANI